MAKLYAAATPPDDIDPRIEALVHELIGRVADKWTMLILEVLGEHGELRFTRLGELVRIDPEHSNGPGPQQQAAGRPVAALAPITWMSAGGMILILQPGAGGA